MGDTTNYSSPSPFPKIHYSCTYNINQEPRYFSSKKKKTKIFLVKRLSTATLGCHLKKEGNLSWDLYTSILLQGKHLPINL